MYASSALFACLFSRFDKDWSLEIFALESLLSFSVELPPEKIKLPKKAKQRQLGTQVKQNIVPAIFVTPLCYAAESIYDGNTFNFHIFPEFVNSCATLIII